MAEGTIKRIIDGSYGFITPDDRSDDVYFKLRWIKNLSGSQVTEGMRVRYETQRTNKGIQTRWIEAISEGAVSTTAYTDHSANTDLGTHRFLNPYNFIRYLDAPDVDKDSPVDQRLLWRCPPPPHDRYVGLSGRITCEVENVTPLFVSDSHAIEVQALENGKQHFTYRFFEYEGKPALPASSLRGMIRTVFEAVTNSCFGVFDDRKLSEHFDSRRAPWLVPARVEKNGDEWSLRLLPGSTLLQIEEPGKNSPDGMQYAAWAASYWPISPSKTLRGIDPKRFHLRQGQRKLRDTFIKRTETPFHNPDGIQHGELCYALLREFQHPIPKVKFWDVVEVRRHREGFPKGQQPYAIEGWLCINNQNIEAKHSERFFFPKESSLIIELPEPVRKNYEALIVDYQHRHASTVAQHASGQKAADDMALSRFIYNEAESHLEGGELVYALLSGSVDDLTIEFIAPVAVPRVSYEQSIGDLLAQYPHLLTCKDHRTLCPACRTFGWVHPDPPEDNPELITAYAGRVRLSHARRISDNGTLDDTPLAILSTPKPTTTQFYLLNKEGEPNAYVDYNTQDAQLRGRKVYRHHGEANPKEYEYQGKELSDQHRTVRGALKPDAKFKFTVDFENLMPVELGALLYALELEDGLVHRLGYAKPLGFGSTKVRVTSIATVDWKMRLASVEPEAGWQPPETQREEIERRKTDFLAQMRALYGAEAFEAILADLRALLGPPPENLPIHYPRPTENLDMDKHPQFEWFVGNKKRVERYPNKIEYRPVVLRKADEDQEGLPLIDSEGNPVL